MVGNGNNLKWDAAGSQFGYYYYYYYYYYYQQQHPEHHQQR